MGVNWELAEKPRDRKVKYARTNGQKDQLPIVKQFNDIGYVRPFKGDPGCGKNFLKILFLADDRHSANVVQDHIVALRKHSQHEIVIFNPIHALVYEVWGTLPFDAILIHYSIFVLGEYFLPSDWREFICKFPGPKVQIIQDEHRHIKRMKRRMAELGIDAVLSSLDVHNLEKVYGGELLRGTSFFGCLPGYISEKLRRFDPPRITSRPLDVVYRGRDLPYKLGRHSQEKRLIGLQMGKLAREYDLKVDIASNEDSRIYGEAWYDFLQTGRATLGVEGGASIFDFDDNLDPAVEEYLRDHPGADFEEVWEAVLKPYEGNVVHRTITPRIFEAIATKTALILYPGFYRGILDSERHYIPMKRDGSNAREVIQRLQDKEYLQNLVDRTHDEILSRVDLSMEFYVGQVDQVLSNMNLKYVQEKSWGQRAFRTYKWFFESSSLTCSRMIQQMLKT